MKKSGTHQTFKFLSYCDLSYKKEGLSVKGQIPACHQIYRIQVNKFEQVRGCSCDLWLANGIMCSGQKGNLILPVNRMTDTTENVIFRQTMYTEGNDSWKIPFKNC